MKKHRPSSLQRQVHPVVSAMSILTAVSISIISIAYFLSIRDSNQYTIETFQTKDVSAQVSAFGNAIQFNGAGVQDGDRVKIPVRNTAANIGATDTTLEFWINATTAGNQSSTCAEGNDTWINGNIIVDRDIFNTPSYGDFGISLYGGRIAYGVHNGSQGMTICSAASVADGQWHHIAVQRRISDGMLYIYIDGTLSRSYDGPNGNISYNNARTTTWANDPFLVIGAEKHDYDPSNYPSYRGLFDELRISSSLRYAANFSRPTMPFVTDSATLGLYHFDESGTPATTSDLASGVNGQVRYYNSYPRFVNSSIPSSGQTPMPTAVPTATPISTATPQPTVAPTASPSPTAVPTILPTPTATPTPPPPSSTPIAGSNYLLRFDGTNDVMTGRDVPALSTYTVEAWVRRSRDRNTYETVMSDASSNYSNNALTIFIDGGSFDCGAGDQFAFYQRNPDQMQCSGVSAAVNQWYHIAVTRESNGTRRFFVNGQLANTQNNTVAGANSAGIFSLGRAGSYNGEFFAGELDEVHLTTTPLYTANFSPSTSKNRDSGTIFLYKMTNGSGQTVADNSNNGRTGTLGTTTSTQSNDPTWQQLQITP